MRKPGVAVRVGAGECRLVTRFQRRLSVSRPGMEDLRTMPYATIHNLGVLLPIAANADTPSLACALDRPADPALAHGRAIYAEHLVHRAESLREAKP